MLEINAVANSIVIPQCYKDVVDFLPLTTEVMNKAADFWAEARHFSYQLSVPLISGLLKIFVGEYAQNCWDMKF
ncbi:MAG: hypothetical protein F6K24_41445 [Okeania sp. SIO2D1]|uniref:hypothetical protein n=1 Tax=Okeania sp. SIO2C9 TaxID=2607791 RepID=UPI0013BC1A71|nr:hypothetical protein [Okeania sp. SIO2C9]NEQ73208.1 hypothetical protein [Okeania sp. SIO2C9]NES71222.1 hypothetical protein [Okeania sp. SIO2D1]